jgi:hypothetical protein
MTETLWLASSYSVCIYNNAVDLVSLSSLLCVIITMIIMFPQRLIVIYRSGSHYLNALLTLYVIEGMIDDAVRDVT